MKAKKGDLYMLLDGTYAAPGECSAGADGVLRHANGVPVALREDGEPMTLAAVTDENAKAAAPDSEPEA